MKVLDWSEDDYRTEIMANRRLRRLERRAEIKARYHDKNGEVVKYLPIEDGYLVTSRGEVLAYLKGPIVS